MWSGSGGAVASADGASLVHGLQHWLRNRLHNRHLPMRRTACTVRHPYIVSPYGGLDQISPSEGGGLASVPDSVTLWGRLEKGWL